MFQVCLQSSGCAYFGGEKEKPRGLVVGREANEQCSVLAAICLCSECMDMQVQSYLLLTTDSGKHSGLFSAEEQFQS